MCKKGGNYLPTVVVRWHHMFSVASHVVTPLLHQRLRLIIAQFVCNNLSGACHFPSILTKDSCPRTLLVLNKSCCYICNSKTIRTILGFKPNLAYSFFLSRISVASFHLNQAMDSPSLSVNSIILSMFLLFVCNMKKKAN